MHSALFALALSVVAAFAAPKWPLPRGAKSAGHFMPLSVSTVRYVVLRAGHGDPLPTTPPYGAAKFWIDRYDARGKYVGRELRVAEEYEWSACVSGMRIGERRRCWAEFTYSDPSAHPVLRRVVRDEVVEAELATDAQ